LSDPAKRDAVERFNQFQVMNLMQEERPAFGRELREWVKKRSAMQMDGMDQTSELSVTGFSRRC
jgi:hypothetical protein